MILLSCVCLCFVSLLCGAVGWSVIMAFACHIHLFLFDASIFVTNVLIMNISE